MDRKSYGGGASSGSGQSNVSFLEFGTRFVANSAFPIGKMFRLQARNPDLASGELCSGGFDDELFIRIFCKICKPNFCISLGSGCDAVGRAVASFSRDPRFECSHQQCYFGMSLNS